jgi:NADH:ubiquinone oxidoreductase subunit 6 (subunit J)
MGQLAVFIVLSAVTLIAAFVVVTSKNIVRSAMSLVPAFLGVTGLYVLLQAEFVAGIQILIYAGAISVLILFVIMLTEGGTGLRMRQSNDQVPWGLATAGVLAVIMVGVLTTTKWPIASGQLPDYTAAPIGQAFMTTHLLVFEVTSIVLLIALIGALVIARKER